MVEIVCEFSCFCTRVVLTRSGHADDVRKTLEDSDGSLSHRPTSTARSPHLRRCPARRAGERRQNQINASLCALVGYTVGISTRSGAFKLQSFRIRIRILTPLETMDAIDLNAATAPALKAIPSDKDIVKEVLEDAASWCPCPSSSCSCNCWEWPAG